jgi:hypothetical protein
MPPRQRPSSVQVLAQHGLLLVGPVDPAAHSTFFLSVL